ncbi:MAG: FAD-binding oxidoreductase [Pseudomonadota bacterium]
MNLLFANDKPGQYPQSWYAATADLLPPFPPLRGETRADVCVIGGGYTGLSAALHLAQAGRRVVLLEAQRVGFGASGRNGGQLGTGQRADQDALERQLGMAQARRLWDLALDATQLVKDLIAKHQIDCHLKLGLVHAASRARDVADLHAYAQHLQDRYAYDQIETLDAQALQAICPSPDYKGGTLDHSGGHVHPLRYALGLAQAAQKAGATIHETSQVVELQEGPKVTVRCAAGHVVTDHVILGCNGYLGALNAPVAARVMPINNFIVATAPLGPRAAEVLTRDVAVADSRFVLNYFRLSHDGRLLFGGGESYGYRFPKDIAATVRKPLSVIFPHLQDVPIDYAWGGTLGITMSRMPYLARLGPNILSASGYSGHGVGTASFAGKLMAEAIVGESAGFDTLAAVPAQRFPGGPALRSPLLALAMTWYALRDRIGV